MDEGISPQDLDRRMGSISVAYLGQQQMSEEEIRRIKSMSVPQSKSPFPAKTSKQEKEAVAYLGQKQMSEEEIQRIKAINLPQVKSPYPAKTNKHAKEALAEAHTWARQPPLCKMYRSQKVMDAHTGADFDLCGLAMRVYEDVEEKPAAFSGKLILWTFALDDYIDGGATFDDPSKTAALLWELSAIIMWSFPDHQYLCQNFANVVSSGDATQQDAALAWMNRTLADAKRNTGTFYDTSAADCSPFSKALGELWATVAASSPPEFLLRFGISIQRYVLSNLTEVISRNCKTILPLAEYIEVRRRSVAMEVFMVIVEFLNNIYLPDEVFFTPGMQRIITAANDIVAWLNDICSFKKEILQGDLCNLVGVISNELNCTFEEAAERAFLMSMTRIADLDKDISDLRRITPPEHRTGVEMYIQASTNWAWRSYEWYCNSKRYNFDV
nr:terpene synthase [Radula lindenbergiana]